MPSMRTYNLFISHSWTHTDAYDKLCNLLDKASLFNYKNYSVPKDDPIHNARNISELSSAIRTQMTPCHIVIVLAGVYASYSTWIDREIALASNGFASPKPVLGVKPWGNRRTSTVVA